MMKSTTLVKILGSAALLLTAGNLYANDSVDIKYAPGTGPVIRYPWKVTLGDHSTAELVRHVGAKSASEPAQEEPLKGWTHFTDWVELTLTEPVLLTVEVAAQAGVHYTTFNSETNVTTDLLAGASLYPASSIYQGVDGSTEVGHMYNPKGDFAAKINFMKYTEDTAGKKAISYKMLLEPGQYSVAIAGLNAAHCKATDACFNGRHGYRAKLTTEPAPIRVDAAHTHAAMGTTTTAPAHAH
ncbi:MAG: hypothetical protein Q7U38_11550 [Methylobacter sp.]|nr:hypothetical protein [Methylobacter sp.]MDP2098608.1 hypothetical protein [Methylobacter sp.]MDP2426952.1 hypothetical protein [Methylobacter sp.]MDP3056191.1 hypothetical protein [Methylobacter sp.]MDP3360602.1 hypothetical protein [Methylobacter sp.]